MTIQQRKWAVWREDEGWTVLHWAAEYLNKRQRGRDWLDEIQIESFVEHFVLRGGDVNAVILGAQNPAYGTAALHMVVYRRVSPYTSTRWTCAAPRKPCSWMARRIPIW